MKLIFRKCDLCKNVIWSFNDTNIKCCETDMRVLKANSVDAAFEKHVPTYEVKDSRVVVKVNHVMEDNHYIMWILMDSDNEIQYKEFKPGETPVAEFKYIENAEIYSYCHLHELWMTKIN